MSRDYRASWMNEASRWTEAGAQSVQEVEQSHPRCCDAICGWSRAEGQKLVIEPKQFFKNERTLLNWLEATVMIGSLATAICGLSNKSGLSAVYGLVLFPVAIVMAIYATSTYLWRRNRIFSRDRTEAYDDRFGVHIYAGGVILVFSIFFLVSLVAAIRQNKAILSDGEL